MFKSGFIGIVGRPNVGKSTLLNAVIGENLAIATHKPQTTRNHITGILNVEQAQMIFVDTPGIHKASTILNRQMVAAATDTFKNADALCVLVEAGAGLHRDDRDIIDAAKKTGLPIVIVINKTDLVVKTKLLPLIDEIRQCGNFEAIIPVSALTGYGIADIIEELRGLLPEGPPHFPEDMMTDRSERFIASEIIRKQIIVLTHQEIPYATAVVVDAFKEVEAKNLIRIKATIHVEKESQKGILIGKKGAMLKKIGTLARTEMEAFFAAKIFLELYVRVQKDWTQDARMLHEFGYSGKT
jgi:GTP-binding protein Era